MSTDPDRKRGWGAFALPFAMVAILVLFLIVGRFWPTAPDDVARCQRKAPPWLSAECEARR